MTRKMLIFAAAAVLIALISFFTLRSVTTVMPHDPTVEAEQLVLVVSNQESANKAVLQGFVRVDGEWKFNFACPAVLGKNGMAWGRGLHRENTRLSDEPVKREGDGRSPKGAYELLRAYGYQKNVRIKFPYVETAPEMICIDDSRSEYYNMIVRDEKIADAPDTSHEQMMREDDLYKYAILVGHNTDAPEKNAGSCIFIHIWRDSDSYTAGCTAVSEANIMRLLSWLDPAKKPCFVQLTRRSYLRLKEEWGLPDVTI
jgi:L,D-peptidoglycan transpeptidase YkuD (ErfK/YbiS/YcfS/YnhG family)